MENLKWDQDTMPSEILKQILDQESKKSKIKQKIMFMPSVLPMVKH